MQILMKLLASKFGSNLNNTRLAHFFKQSIARHVILIGTLYTKCITKQCIQNLNHD